MLTHLRTRLPTQLAVLLAAVALVAGCTTGKGSIVSVGDDDGDAQVISITPAEDATKVRPDTPIKVEVSEGALSSVSVNDPEGRPVKGKFSADHSRWTSRQGMRPASWYVVTAQGVDADDDPVFAQSNFRTLQADKRLAARIAPLEGETVGVGMPIAVYFTAPVRNRAAVERRFRVTDQQSVTGAWRWFSDTEMHYRPKAYWPAGDRVTLKYDVRGVNAGRGVWGDDARTIRFRIGSSHVSRVDARTHTMKVYEDGDLVRSINVSTGRDEFPTSSGIHVVLEKAAIKTMDSSTIGIPRDGPGGYFLTVPWSVRISYSGEFVHAASWSVQDQGRRNVSHGCVNLSPTDGEWFYNFARRGDIVDVVGTPKKLQQGNGYADWNLSWREWLAGSALA